MKQKILIIFLYLLPILGFVTPSNFWLKFSFSFLLSIPGLVYLFKEKSIFRISYIGDWKKSLRFELSWMLPIFICIAAYRYFYPVSEFGFTGAGSMASQVPPLVFFFLYSVISSPLQEFIFRGLMMFHIGKFVKSKYWVVFLSAFIFGISHIWYPLLWVTPATFFLGLIWGYDMIQNKSLIGVSFSHAFVGLTAFFFGLI